MLLDAVQDQIIAQNNPELTNPNQQQVDIPHVAGSRYFTRYFDQLCRMSVVLHVLNLVSENQLRNQDARSIPTVITLATLESAKCLVDTLTLHKSILLQVCLMCIKLVLCVPQLNIIHFIRMETTHVKYTLFQIIKHRYH